MSHNKMLIDATHPEETRVVVLRGGRVEEFDYESAARKILRGNIYLAKVTRVEPSLQAAFVDYGGNRHGFLAFNEIHPDYYQIPMADRQALLDEEAAAEAEEEAAADARAEAMARRRSAREQSRGQQRRRDPEADDSRDDASNGDDGDDAGADEQPYEVRPHGEGYDENGGRDDEDEAGGGAEGEDRSRSRRGRRGRGRRGRDRGDRGEMRGRSEHNAPRDDESAGDAEHAADRERFAAGDDAGRNDPADGHASDREPAPGSAHEAHHDNSRHDASHHDDEHGDDEHGGRHDQHHHDEHARADADDHRDPHDHDDHDHSHDHDDHRHGHDAAPAAPHADDDHGRQGDGPRTLSEARGLADERRSAPAPVADDGDDHDDDHHHDHKHAAAADASDATPVSKGNVQDEGVHEVNSSADAEQVDQVGSEDALEELPSRPRRRPRSYKIQEVIKRRQIILVQVVKEERGNKGAALTTYLSLAGRYTVLMPNTARGGGISRKITQPQDRKRLKAIAASLEVPEGMGLIIRTAGAARTAQEIKRDFEYLLRLWESVRDLTLQSVAPSLVYEEGNLIKRSIRDLYNKEIDEILVAGGPAHAEAHDFMRMLMPSQAKNVINYREAEPLFTRFQIERQLNAMFSPFVTLRSGGYLVINQTEALVAIDINSGRSTREFSIEETALNTNLEAADEIARQLKLRDLAGLIVIDFIDMEERRNNRRVENRMKDALRFDRARIQVGRISHFGLLEMSRQRLRTGVLEGSTSQCPHCQGTGIIRSTESVALAVLRGLEDAIMAGARTSLVATTTPTVALYILNNKRAFVVDMERRTGLPIVVQGSEKMQGANFTIEKGAAPPQSRRPERTAVNMDWGFEGEGEGEIEHDVAAVADADADDGDVEGHDDEPRGRGQDDEQRNSNGEDGGRRRRRRRRRGRRGDRAEGAEQGMSGDGGDDDGQPYGEDGDADGDRGHHRDGRRDERSPAPRDGRREGGTEARTEGRTDLALDADNDEQDFEAADDGEHGADAATGDANGRKRGRRRGRRGGRRGRDRDRGGMADGAEDLSTTGYTTQFDDGQFAEALGERGHGGRADEPRGRRDARTVEQRNGEQRNGEQRIFEPRNGDVAPVVTVEPDAETPAPAERERHRAPKPAAAAAEAMVAASEVSETAPAVPLAAPVAAEPASPAASEPAPRRRSMTSGEPKIERVTVGPDAAQTQDVTPGPTAEPRKGWWSRKLLG